MRNTKKAFTLVELIVVITILAILATVAFVSLGGQTDNARNTVKKDKLGKLATSIENARTNSLALSSFASGVTVNQISGTIAGTGVNVGTDYNAGDVNLTALDVKADDFKDGETQSFIYGYTTKTGGKYELAATIKEGDLQKAYVVGTFQPRGTDTISGTGTVNNGKTYITLRNSTDIKKLGYGDYITDGTHKGSIIAVSSDYMTLTVNADFAMGSTATSVTIGLDAADAAGLINSTTSGTPVQNNTEYVPYTLQ